MFKKLFAISGVALVLGALLIPQLPLTSATSYPEDAEAFPDAYVIQHDYSGSFQDFTDEAQDSDTDITWDLPESFHDYIGFSDPFHGFTAELSTPENIEGSYSLYYWNGSNWSSLSGSVDTGSDYYSVTWNAPEDWEKTSVGDSSVTTSSLYFVKYTTSDANFDAYASRIGIQIFDYVAIVENDDGDKIENATVKAGDDLDVTCDNFGDGRYGCAVPLSDTDGRVTISASGYDSLDSTFDDVRYSSSDDTVETTFVLDSTSSSDSDSHSASDDPNLTVNDLKASDNDFVVVMENDGDDDANEDVQYTIYVDGDKEDEDYFDENYFEENETLTWTFRDFFDEEDDDESYKVEVCLDEDDDIDEESESDNCRTETLTVDGTDDNDDDNNDDDDDSDEDLPDLYVSKIELNDDAEVEFTIKNKGDHDVSTSDDVTVKIYVDGDKEWSKTYDDSEDFYDEGDSSTFNAGELLDEEDETYEVEVCVDTSDEVDEQSESNNCETEDLNIDDDVELASDECDAFYDIDSHWAEEYICHLYDRGVVEGRVEDRYYYPNSYTTRAEFAKMVLLSAGEEVDANSRYEYDDVQSSGKWYYQYVTYGTEIGMLTGYEGTDDFKPNDYINRAEAVAMLMRMEEDLDFDVDDSDIDFDDVDDRDWFASAIVVASDYDFIEGYSNGDFRPSNYITRGEAAKIVDLAYDEFYAD